MNGTANNNRVYNQISYEIDRELVFACQFLKTGSYMVDPWLGWDLPCRTGWPYFQERHRDLPLSATSMNHFRLLLDFIELQKLSFFFFFLAGFF